MEQFIEVKERKTWEFNATEKEKKDLAQKFEFDRVDAVKGSLSLEPVTDPVPCWLLKGQMTAKLVFEGEEQIIDFPIETYIVSSERELKELDMKYDAEIENAKGQIDLGDLLGQHIYLSLMEY